MRQERDEKTPIIRSAPAEGVGGQSTFGLGIGAVQVGIESFVVAAAPIIAYFLLRVSLINQDRFVDPWLYTGYGREFKLLEQLHGWNYYATRFPVILLQLAVSQNFDPILSYAFLRYLLILSCGIPLYLWARRYFGIPYAIAAYLFLLCNPLFPRLLLWDLTPFVSVPMALAGITCWLLPAKPSSVGRGLSGFAFCASIASHAFTGVAIAVFLTVELARRLLRREYTKLIALDLTAPFAGAVLCTAIGLAGYYMILGPFDPMAIFTVTLGAIRQGDQYAASNASALNTWIWTNSNVVIPALLLGFVAIGSGRELFKESAVSRVWWFSFVYGSCYAIYQFLFHRFVLETFYYFFHLTIVVYLLFPACLYLITRNLSADRRALVVVSAMVLLILMPLFQSLFVIEPQAFKYYFDRFALVWIAATLAAVFAIRQIRRLSNTGVAAIYALALTSAVQVLGLSAPAFAIYSNPYQAREFDVYEAGVEMLNVLDEYTKPGKRVTPWFPANELSISYSLSSATILDSVSKPLETEGGMPAIGDYERARLRAPDAGYVMMLSEDPRLIAKGKQALIENGFSYRDVTHRIIGGTHFKAHLDLIELVRSPSAAGAQ